MKSILILLLALVIPFAIMAMIENTTAANCVHHFIFLGAMFLGVCGICVLKDEIAD